MTPPPPGVVTHRLRTSDLRFDYKSLGILLLFYLRQGKLLSVYNWAIDIPGKAEEGPRLTFGKVWHTTGRNTNPASPSMSGYFPFTKCSAYPFSQGLHHPGCGGGDPLSG